MAPERVFLHVGAPKTGTTYLQGLLASNRAALKTDGVLYPRSASGAHHTAAWDLRDTPAQRKDAQGIEGAWRKLVDKANSWDGDAVLISSELFVYATPAQVRKALASFTGQVHIIYTARDLIRQVPAVWQERVKNAKTLSYREFVQSVMDARAAGNHSFWRAQNAATVARKWSRGLDPARFVVVTAPPSGGPPISLWTRFLSVLGRSADAYSAQTPGPVNESLGMLQTELLRRYNVRHGGGLPWPTYRATVKSQLDIFSEAISDRRKLELGAAERQFFAAAAHGIAEQLRAGGYSVVGDLGDLTPVADEVPSAGSAGDPTALGDEELLDAAIDVVHEVLSRAHVTKQELRGQGHSAEESDD